MLCQKVGLNDKKSGEHMFPLTSQELMLYSVSEALGSVCACMSVSVCGQEVTSARVYILPKHRCQHQVGQVLKPFPLVLFQLLNPGINLH